MPTHTNKQPKTGGNAVKNISDLMVPFGLILAKESLEKFLKKQKTASPKSRKVSLKGGAGCSASGSLSCRPPAAGRSCTTPPQLEVRRGRCR